MNRVVHTSIKKNAFPRTGRVIDSVGGVAGLGSGNYSGGLGVSHSHENKSLIDQITQGNIDVLSLFEIIDGKLKIKTDVYSVGEVSAYGVGSTSGSGASGSLGGLVNVGSWADELPSADRVMIQLAGSTHWSSKLISEIAGLDTVALGSYLTTNLYATQSFVATKVAELIGSAPETLNTLNELATALGNDPNFATSITTLIGTKWTQDNTKIANWDSAYSNIHLHANKSVIDLLTQDHLNILSHLSIVEGRIKVDTDLWSTGELSAYGTGSSTGGGTGLITSVLGSGGLGGSYLNSDLTNTFNAYTINLINNNLTSALGRIGALETSTPNVAWGTPTSSYVPLSINLTSKNISLDGHSHTFASLSSKPTTLSGYGIIDALGINSNAASATKLATPRNIWGQTFDGTGNVTGRFNLDGVDNSLFSIFQNGLTAEIQSYTGFMTLNAGGNNVLIGTRTDSGYKLDVNGNARFSFGSKFKNICIEVDANGSTTGRDSEINCYNSSLAIQYNTPNNVNFCQGGGNVLIGTSVDVGYKFDVNGTGRFVSSLITNGYLSANGIVYAGGGLVAYSNSSISGNLTVSGKVISTTFNFTSATGGTIQSNDVNILRISGTKDMVLSTPIAAKIYFRPNGDISTTGQMILDQAGNLVAVGEVTAFSASDVRLKYDIRPLLSSLDIINKLNPVSYKWNSTAKELNPLKNDSQDYGLIAQELEFVMPELVHTIYGGQYKSIDYVKLIPHLICAIKQLKTEIEALKNNNNIIHI